MASGTSAYATTDATGRFELSAIPVGRFTVEAVDPNSGRLGRASDELVAEGQTVDVTILQLLRRRRDRARAAGRRHHCRLRCDSLDRQQQRDFARASGEHPA
jgi:hypothetical protein